MKKGLLPNLQRDFRKALCECENEYLTSETTEYINISICEYAPKVLSFQTVIDSRLWRGDDVSTTPQ